MVKVERGLRDCIVLTPKYMIFKLPSKPNNSMILWINIQCILKPFCISTRRHLSKAANKGDKLLFESFLAWLEIKDAKLRQQMICINVQFDLEDEIFELLFVPYIGSRGGIGYTRASAARLPLAWKQESLWGTSGAFMEQSRVSASRGLALGCWESWHLKRGSEDTGDTRASEITRFHTGSLHVVPTSYMDGPSSHGTGCWVFAVNSCVFQSSPGVTTDKTRQ